MSRIGFCSLYIIPGSILKIFHTYPPKGDNMQREDFRHPALRLVISIDTLIVLLKKF